ncbi:hypothetical protein CNE02720 [Cryptococcus deneoformans JEC21]|uniref:Uncharacterized protein n=1 Tax=Cryptococcus deneoformans (strain JEC21 / ATCC MYA-565) TaxID=214684 RepID=Q5KGQ5_CRYD1|nr:hypothetical protein CNE02720 [Cryptococcus neoformans var. neoformans JEC21]AAW43673.1 hypothetical protein CNE02720 [Cryptococcus neoformans var. neoformans JEC21]
MSSNVSSSPSAETSSLRARRSTTLDPQTPTSSLHSVPSPNSTVVGTSTSPSEGVELSLPPKSVTTNGEPSSTASTNVYFPGGLPLPAVKGVISGIDSPRHGRGSPSIGNRRDIPGSPVTPTTSTTVRAEPAQQRPTGEVVVQQEEYRPRVVFRSDPTVKSCLLGLKMEKKDEIAKLFGVI